MSTLNQLNSIYIGTVIANDDPEFAGRVKVRVEGITSPLPGGSSYKFPAGRNVNGLTQSEIDQTRESCVWAMVAGPVMGESSLGKYNRTKDISSSADFTNVEGMENVENGYDDEGRQTPPSSQFRRIRDGFHSAGLVKVQKTNPYSYSYMAQGYANSPKGSYSVLAVGAKVFVQFIAGSYRNPVVIGVVNTKTGYSNTFGDANSLSYPSVFENVGVSSEE